MIAGVVTMVWPISSIVVLATVSGAWLVAQRRQVTHLGVLRRDGASQHTVPNPGDAALVS